MHERPPFLSRPPLHFFVPAKRKGMSCEQRVSGIRLTRGQPNSIPRNPTTATLAQINVVTSSASDSPKLSMGVHSHLNVTTLAAGLTWLGQSPRRSPTVLGTAFARCTRFRLRTCPRFASARLVPQARPGTSNGPESTCKVEHPVSPTSEGPFCSSFRRCLVLPS